MTKDNKKDKKVKKSHNSNVEKKPNIIFRFFDAVISIIIKFFTYIFWGGRILILCFWKYVLKAPSYEIYYLVKAIINGVMFLAMIIFRDVPLAIYNVFSKIVFKIYTWFKSLSKKTKEGIFSGKTASKKIIEYFKSKYENISFVKEAREKMEANLTVLTMSGTGDDAKKTENKQTYKYLARNKEGKLITGYFAALSKLDVYSYLLDEGMVVYEIKTSWAINFFHTEASSLKRKMSNKDLIFWLAQLSTYIKAGIPLAEAVKIIAKQDKRRKYKGVYDSIIYELAVGNPFSECLKKQGSVFPPLLINMVKSSELIGDIESTLDEMSQYYQEIEDTKKAIISAITYPVIILVFAVGVIIFMLVYIIPQFVGVYESMNAGLNPMTIATINMSNYLSENWKMLILGVCIVVLLLSWLYRKVKAFKALIQRLCMKLPVIGKLIIYKELSIFSRTFATLNKNNVLLTSSIDILRKITNNEIYKGIMMKTINNLLKGEKMSASFKDHWAIPEIAYHMMVTGESTGELAVMLEKIGDYYQKEERVMVNQIKTFIEPLLIAFMAVGVGFILISVLIPMFGIYNQI